MVPVFSAMPITRSINQPIKLNQSTNRWNTHFHGSSVQSTSAQYTAQQLSTQHTATQQQTTAPPRCVGFHHLQYLYRVVRKEICCYQLGQKSTQEIDLRDPLPPQLQLLQEYLPDGSVYRWAAKLGGASLSDAMLGWIVLLVRLTIRAII